ncbi:hypothetical protein B0H10DRAFT_1356004 [Mycena sp. CBHHK59/15]|nr:hypothetical protein B0H10DRAFT_1356004 [Mycena sp. CBHHK59/15]
MSVAPHTRASCPSPVPPPHMRGLSRRSATAGQHSLRHEEHHLPISRWEGASTSPRRSALRRGSRPRGRWETTAGCSCRFWGRGQPLRRRVPVLRLMHICAPDAARHITLPGSARADVRGRVRLRSHVAVFEETAGAAGTEMGRAGGPGELSHKRCKSRAVGRVVEKGGSAMRREGGRGRTGPWSRSARMRSMHWRGGRGAAKSSRRASRSHRNGDPGEKD